MEETKKEGDAEEIEEMECGDCGKEIFDGERYFARVISIEYVQGAEIVIENAIAEEVLCLKCAKQLGKLGDLEETTVIEKE